MMFVIRRNIVAAVAVISIILLLSTWQVNSFTRQGFIVAPSLSKHFVYNGKRASGGGSSSSTKPIMDKVTSTWKRAPSDNGEYPYDAFGALLRHGPSPFVQRLVNPNGYEQSVLEYMANTGCSRAEATGNMDAKLNNAADWAFQKLEEKKTGKKVDYTVLNQQDAILTIVWALGITPLVVYSVIQTFSQFGTGPSVIKY